MTPAGGAPAAVVVGASVAGVRTAQALRAEGFAAPIVLIGAERAEPYDKPPLSKQFLAGDWDERRVALFSRSQAASLGVELRLGLPAVGLSPGSREVVLADGSRVRYGSLVIATGAVARPSPWSVESGLHVVRGLADAASLGQDLRRGGRVVVIGAGFIGCEVAAIARRFGCAVCMVDPLPVPMAGALGVEVGSLVGDLHRRRGVSTRFGVAVVSVCGRSGDLKVQLADGEVLAADTVVVGIGAVPADGWLAGSGLRLDDGVLCDSYCRAEGVADVWAAGDVARWLHPDRGRPMRVEHWTNAVDQAGLVARNIAHPDRLVAYAPVEYVWSDQYDWKIQIVGTPGGDVFEVVGRASGDRPRLAALYAGAGGSLAGAVTLNWPRAAAILRRRASLDERGRAGTDEPRQAGPGFEKALMEVRDA